MIKILIKSIYESILTIKFCKKHKIRSRSHLISRKAIYGKNVSFGKNVIVDDDCKIDDFTYVNSNSSIENCSIGKFCSISENVKINPIDHNYSLVSTHPYFGDNGHYGQKNAKVIIGNDVLISLNVVILKGVTIGDGAVIGAGAIVTHDVPPYAIVAGNPAKIIKYRFDSNEISRLLNEEWWDWPIEKINSNFDYFRKVKRS